MHLYRLKGQKKGTDPRDSAQKEYEIWQRYCEIRDGREWDGIPPKKPPEAKEQLANEIGMNDFRRIEQIVSYWDTAKEEHDRVVREECE